VIACDVDCKEKVAVGEFCVDCEEDVDCEEELGVGESDEDFEEVLGVGEFDVEVVFVEDLVIVVVAVLVAAPTAAVESSGHSSTEHASTEQHPWKFFAAHTYQSWPELHSRESRCVRRSRLKEKESRYILRSWLEGGMKADVSNYRVFTFRSDAEKIDRCRRQLQNERLQRRGNWKSIMVKRSRNRHWIEKIKKT
jgi:hypothetical protein